MSKTHCCWSSICRNTGCAPNRANGEIGTRCEPGADLERLVEQAPIVLMFELRCVPHGVSDVRVDDAMFTG